MPSTELRVSSWNVRNGLAFLADRRDAWWLRRRAALQTIAELDADVLGLQEAYAFQRRYVARHLPTHELTGFGRDDGRGKGEQCVVAVRRERFAVESAEVRWFSDDPLVPRTKLPGASHPRIATLVALRDRASGEVVHVADVHLDQRVAANRERSAELLLEWTVGRRPLIVLGDLNAGPDDVAVRRLEAGGLHAALPTWAPPTAHAWLRSAHPRRLDHIVVSGEWEVRSWAVPHSRPRGRPTSDHWPVSAVLVSRRPAPTPAPAG